MKSNKRFVINIQILGFWLSFKWKIWCRYL